MDRNPRSRLHIAMRSSGLAVATALAAGVLAQPAAAQSVIPMGAVGPTYLELPGIKGDAKLRQYDRWVRAEAYYWQSDRAAMEATRRLTQQANADQQAEARPASASGGNAQRQGGGGGFGRQRAAVSLPMAPLSGEGKVALSIAKSNPALPALMERCRTGGNFAEARLAVDPMRSRMFFQAGPRPPSVPEYVEFKFADAKIVECPVVKDAPEQALVMSFANIEWLNIKAESPGQAIPIELQPAALKPLPRLSGQTKSWVLTWIAMANDVSDDQCPVMAEKPTEADYYALMSKEEADKERVALAGQGGPNYQNGQMGRRGPNRLDVTALPGIIADPGHPSPQTKVARGLNLDGDDGTRRKHKNYVSADGKITGIDNQLYTAKGCIAGWQGHKGFITQFANNQMRDGMYSLIVEVSGIDNEKNDDEVYVTIAYSSDPMAKNSAGTAILSDYSFDLSNDIQYTPYFNRFKGKIVDGAVITEPVKNFTMDMGVYGSPPEMLLEDARMRFDLNPDGTIKGVLAGYTDWRRQAIGTEFYFGFQVPGLYNSLKRNADGMRNPATGEYDGISAAYDIEGVPAFVVRPSSHVAGRSDAAGSVRQR